MNNKITTLIFDLGGVIINIDPSLTIKEFNLLAKRNSDILNGLDYKIFKSNEMLNFFFDFEKGLISENNFAISPVPQATSTRVSFGDGFICLINSFFQYLCTPNDIKSFIKSYLL